MADAQLAGVLRQIRRLVQARTAEEASDGRLLSRFVGGEEAAFALLMERHGPMVHDVCRRTLGAGPDAEDAFQATFLLLARKARSIRKQDSVGSWLHGAAYRIALKARAAAARRRVHERQAGQETRSLREIQARTVGLEAAWRELQAVLDAELNALPEKYRLPLVLCYLEGRTHEEAARQLRWPAGTVGSRLARGRDRLRSRLAQRGLSLAAAPFAVVLAANTSSAALPAALARTTLEAALRIAAGQAVAGMVSAHVVALADAASQSLSVIKPKTIALLLVGLCVLGAGAGVVAQRVSTSKPPEAQRGKEPKAVAKRPEAAKKEKSKPDEKQPRTDRYGDPLPEGAIARLGTVRFRHNFAAYPAGFSPDGRLLASRDWNNVIRLWDVATGQKVLELPGRYHCVTLAPDGKALAVAGSDVFVLDVATGKELVRLQMRQNGILTLRYSPDGKVIAIGCDDGTLRLWSVDKGNELRLVRAHAARIKSTAFSLNSKTLASASTDKTIRLWDVATGQELRRLEGHQGEVDCVAFAPDGKTLASSSYDKTMRLWDVATGQQIRTFGKEEGVVGSVAFSPDGRLLAGTGDRNIRLWDVATGKQLRRWEGHALFIVSVVFSPDGKTLATADYWDSTIHFWDVANGKERHPARGHSGAVEFVAFAPDGKTLLSQGRDKKVCDWDLATGQERQSFGGPANGSWDPVALSPDRETLASGGRVDNTVRLWDRATGKEIRVFGKHHGSVSSVIFSPEGKTLASRGWDHTIRVWDVATGRQRRELKEEHHGTYAPPVQSIRFSPDGKLLASGDAEKSISLWDVGTGRKLRSLASADEARFLTFSPDGQMLASTGYIGKAHLWDVASGKELRPLLGRVHGAYALTFSPDGKLLAAGGGEQDMNAIYVWEVATGQEVRRFQGHHTAILSLAFAPDGRTLASGGADSAILLWDVTGGMKEGRFQATRLTARDLEAHWADLSGDSSAAFPAMWALVTAPGQTLPFLKERLRPTGAADPRRVADLLRGLDSEQFTDREEASRELEKLGELAESALRKTLAGNPSLEVRKRVEQLLQRLDPNKSPELLRLLRSVQVLEQIGSRDAANDLKRLANGAPEARLTQEAKTALQRLAKRTAAKP